MLARINPTCFVFAIPALVLIAGSGCGKEPDATKPAASAPASGIVNKDPAQPLPTASTPSDLDFVQKASKPYKILLIVKTLNNPFFKPMVASFKETATALGVTGDVQAAPQETDVDKQAALVQNAAAQGYQAILITPADSRALIPALKMAADKGVLIVNVDNRLDAASVKTAGLKLAGYVGANNLDGGKLAGQALLEALGGKGKVVVLEGIRGVDNAESRKHGFEDAVKGKLDIVDEQSADWMTEKAHTTMQNMLAAHPDITGVFCANDQMAIGAIKAIKSAGKSGVIKVVSYDNIKEVQPYLQSGELVATIEQHPDLMGANAEKLAIAVLDGKIKPGGDLLVTLEAKKK